MTIKITKSAREYITFGIIDKIHVRYIYLYMYMDDFDINKTIINLIDFCKSDDIGNILYSELLRNPKNFTKNIIKDIKDNRQLYIQISNETGYNGHVKSELINQINKI